MGVQGVGFIWQQIFPILLSARGNWNLENKYAIKNPPQNVKKNIFIVLFLCQYHKVVRKLLSEFHCPAALQKAVWQFTNYNEYL